MKAFEHEPVSHSVAHHLRAVADLHEEFGYARVSDVARKLGITRGSVSITFKGLEEKGLVTYDENRFLGLSEAGRRIAESIRAKREIMRDLFVRVLGVDEDRADEDTCKLEHLISGHTARRVRTILDFLDSGAPEVGAFLDALVRFVKKRGKRGR